MFWGIRCSLRRHLKVGTFPISQKPSDRLFRSDGFGWRVSDEIRRSTYSREPWRAFAV